MAITLVNIGSAGGSGDGDALRLAFSEVNASLTDLDTRLATNTALIGTLGAGAFRSIGTTTGTLADGGALTAETTRATSAEQANTTLINNEVSRAQAAELLKANIASPTFTGVPRAPTATAGSGGTQIATLDFVATAVAAVPAGGGGVSGTPTSRQILTSGLATGGGDLTADRTITVTAATQADVATGTDTTKALTAFSVAAALGAKAPLASPAFTGTPTATTATAGDNSTRIATTAFATGALASYATLASPAFTGVPTAPTQSAADNSTKIATTAYADRSATNAVAAAPAMPSGAVAHFAMATPPTGWMEANGAAISRATYAALFTAIGTTFGAGDGSTTFNLPDLRGQFVRGFDNGRGVDTGRTFGSAQADQIIAHTHTVGGVNSYIVNGGTGLSANIGSGSFLNYGAMSNGGGGTETRPKNIALLVCIKI